MKSTDGAGKPAVSAATEPLNIQAMISGYSFAVFNFHYNEHLINFDRKYHSSATVSQYSTSKVLLKCDIG